MSAVKYRTCFKQ